MRVDRIRELAAAQGKPMGKLAEAIGKNVWCWHDISKVKKDLPAKTLEILAGELHTTPEYLSYKTDDPTQPGYIDPAVADGIVGEICKMLTTMSYSEIAFMKKTAENLIELREE